jgi:hypothetical protein
MPEIETSVGNFQNLLACVREIDGLKNLNRRPERSRVPRRFHVQNQRSGKNMQRAVRVHVGALKENARASVGDVEWNQYSRNF